MTDDERERLNKVVWPVADPLHDHGFVSALASTYSIAPQTDWLEAAA